MKKHVFLYMKALSDFGTFMDMIVLNVVIYTATGSAAWLAATLAARTLGGVIASLFSGVVADRLDRRKVMIWADILRGIIILLLIPFPTPTVIIIGSFLIGFISSFFHVSFSAEIPQMFGEDKVLETNSLISRLTSISLVLGFIGAGLITDILGYKVTLMIDATTYILSAVVLMKLRWDSAFRKTEELASGVKQKLLSVVKDIKEVYLYLKLLPVLLMFNFVFLIGAFAGSSHNLGIPLLAEQVDPLRQSFYYGMIWGVWGIGSVLATYTLPRLKWLKDDKLFTTAYLSAILMSTGFILFLSSETIVIILSIAFLTGIFDAAYTTLYSTILQKTDNHIRGRIFGVGMLLKSLGFALGFIVAPIIMDIVSMKNMVWILHGTFISASVTALIVTLVWKSKQKNMAAVKTI
ncbi:MFS family permease [Bacillus mesophilus]|uniref:MFS transporter n=1 Tax=Bacillus mesophilus TaxID=1808955 RepID=A0A6M0QB64_9BACI|nr:MFS transporter [Bacillus mesophilus]MBM7663049.1 MFS family permease [Bacillus mesophilus]NEY73631.1 MFS transporter [Bacillus mesophilus]